MPSSSWLKALLNGGLKILESGSDTVASIDPTNIADVSSVTRATDKMLVFVGGNPKTITIASIGPSKSDLGLDTNNNVQFGSLVAQQGVTDPAAWATGIGAYLTTIFNADNNESAFAVHGELFVNPKTHANVNGTHSSGVRGVGIMQGDNAAGSLYCLSGVVACVQNLLHGAIQNSTAFRVQAPIISSDGSIVDHWAFYEEPHAVAQHNYGAYFANPVGIKVEKPAYDLDVAGTARITGNLSIAGANTLAGYYAHFAYIGVGTTGTDYSTIGAKGDIAALDTSEGQRYIRLLHDGSKAILQSGYWLAGGTHTPISIVTAGVERVLIAADGTYVQTLGIKNFGKLSAAPSSGYSEGDEYYNTTTHKKYVYDGAAWQACW